MSFPPSPGENIILHKIQTSPGVVVSSDPMGSQRPVVMIQRWKWHKCCRTASCSSPQAPGIAPLWQSPSPTGSTATNGRNGLQHTVKPLPVPGYSLWPPWGTRHFSVTDGHHPPSPLGLCSHILGQHGYPLFHLACSSVSSSTGSGRTLEGRINV